MGSCIICGASVDDSHVCDIHEEDVVFEFRGSRPGQLTPGRFYRGTVDGFAEFGVFVNIGDRVTGLLHRSELDRRLESLDWDVGDTVYVQVTNVRDNGNVDLGWSIRQSDAEFRGTIIDDPEGDRLAGDREQEPDPEESRQPAGRDGGHGGGETASAGGGSALAEHRAAARGPGEEDPEAGAEAEPEAEPVAVEEPIQVAIDDLREHVGEQVRIEGEVVNVRQTGGPTVFEVRDDTAAVDCAAFEEAGVRAYPEVETGEVVRLDGEARIRRDELQVETEALVGLDGDDRRAVRDRLEAALVSAARPGEVPLLADHAGAAAVQGELRDAAEAIRRAVLEARPVIVRHSATADGYVAGAAIERAVLPLVREEHAAGDAEYHYFDRRPLESGVYDMDAATNDVTSMLENRDRHGEKLPLFVFVAAGSTLESREGFDLLEVYDAPRAVIDGAYADAEIADAVDVAVNPHLAGVDPAVADDVSTGALAANVAAHVNPDVREDVAHLPAVSYWDDPPSAYVDLAREHGYGADATRELREALALEAYYQSYEDKRELVTDLLFDGEAAAEAEGAGGLASHVSRQFRERVADEIGTAEANLERREAGGVTFAVLDTEAFTHRYDFPPTGLLLDALHREHRDDDRFVTVGIDTDELHIRCGAPLDVREVAARARERVPNAGLSVRGARDGKLEFVAGERSAVLEAVVAAVTAELSS